MVRESLDKRVVGIDGQWSTSMSVLYQTPHGKKFSEPTREPKGLRVLLTVQCKCGILLIKAAPSEHSKHVLDAIEEAVGSNGKRQVIMIFSDSAVSIDFAAAKQKFVNLKAIAQDPIHLALRVEKVTGENINALSALLRRCLVKWKVGAGAGERYYTKGSPGDTHSTLDDVLGSMSDAVAAARVAAIKQELFPDRAYASVASFVLDVAAICKTHPTIAARPIKGEKTTAFGSLRNSTTLQGLQFLRNGSRFAAKNRDASLMYGTTRNEAFHKQLKSFFRNIMLQLGRNLTNISAVATIAKLVAAFSSQLDTSTTKGEAELLRAAAAHWIENPITFVPLMNHKTQPNPVVDVDTLPASAKRIRRT
jgi:hypothetical protein